MKQNFKFLLSEYRLELSVAGFAFLTLGCLAAIANSPHFDPTPVYSLFFSILGAILILAATISVLSLCFLPTIIAKKRKHKNLTAIFVLNLLAFPSFGLCWIIALVWAFVKP